jgi:hypothetical protein
MTIPYFPFRKEKDGKERFEERLPMRNQTQHTASDFDLSKPQLSAIEALAAGKSMNEAAAAADVDRTTLYRWRRDDDAFRAALAGVRNEVREELSTRILALAAKAFTVVDAALDAGDAKAAIAILRGCGALPGVAPHESDDPRDLRNGRLRAERDREIDGLLI